MRLEKLCREEALRYMGYRGNAPDSAMTALLDQAEEQLLRVIEPKYVYRIFDVENIGAQGVSLKDCELFLEGKDIAVHLEGCRRAALMACTISGGADRLIRINQIRNMTLAYVMDSLASAAVEQVCNAAQQEIASQTGGYCTWRFSCGYGDLPIESQKKFLTVLNAQKRIGVSVSDSFMMTPTKSVTAVFGISDSPLDKKRSDCESCNMKDSCKFRKTGERCGI